MSAWEKYTTPYGTICYRHKASPKYTLRRVQQLSGTRHRLVWALFRYEQRMREIQALSSLWGVRQEAEELAEGARSYAA